MPKFPEAFKTEEPSQSKESIKRKARIVRQGLDLESIKIFPASEVPPPSRVRTPYRELLQKIGKGQATYLSPHDVSLNTAAAAIRKLQRRGGFKNFKVTRRTVDGEKRLYIINEGEKGE
jgi:hypothetical protein